MGFTKILPESFPFDIFSANTKLVKASAVFMNAVPTTPYTNLTLPNEMFANNPNLEDVSGLFYNLQNDYQLSRPSQNTNFKNCTQLKNVQYLFAQDTVNSVAPRLTGPIPYKFF